MSVQKLSTSEQAELDKVVDMVDYAMEKMANSSHIAQNRALWVKIQFDAYIQQGFSRSEAIEFLKSDIFVMNKR